VTTYGQVTRRGQNLGSARKCLGRLHLSSEQRLRLERGEQGNASATRSSSGASVGPEADSLAEVFADLDRTMRLTNDHLCRLTRRGQRSLREMPSLRIMAFRVVRGNPRWVAAVLTTPPVSRSTRMICSRSTCSSVVLPAISIASGRISAKGARRLGPLERMTARSMKFSSSRTFPGQCQLTRARIVSAGILSICRPISPAYFLVKCRARIGMSSGDRAREAS
jgi:hypothetical protein